MLTGLLTELPATGAVELEGDDRTICQGVQLCLGIDEIASGHDTGLVEDIEEANRLHAYAGWRRAPPETHAARKLPGHRGDAQQTVDPRKCCLGNRVLAWDLAPGSPGWLNETAEYATHYRRGVGAGGVLPAGSRRGVFAPGAIGRTLPGLGRVSAEQLLHCRWLSGRALGFDAHAAKHPIHGRQGFFQDPGFVGDLELEEGAALHDGLRSGRVSDSGELNDNTVVSHLLNKRLGDAKLVDALAEHRQCELKISLGVGGNLLRLVQLQCEVHPTLKIEATLQWHTLDDAIAHDTRRGVRLPNRDVARDEIEDAQGDQPQNHEKACSNRHSSEMTHAWVIQLATYVGRR